MAKKRRRREGKTSLPKKRSPRAETRWKRIAQILERTRKGREHFDALARDAGKDPTPVVAPCYLRSMSLHDNATSIEVNDDVYAKLAGAAAAQGKTPSYMLDTILVRALEREQSVKQQSDFDAERARTSTILCDCCRGKCQRVFVWRGQTRCGCVNNPNRAK